MCIVILQHNKKPEFFIENDVYRFNGSISENDDKEQEKPDGSWEYTQVTRPQIQYETGHKIIRFEINSVNRNAYGPGL